MKKRVSIFLLAMVFLAAILVAGCATVGRVEQTELKVAKLEGFTQALNLDLGNVRNDVRGLKETSNSLKTDLGATKSRLQELAQKTEVGLNSIKTDLGAAREQIQGFEKRVISVESDLSATKDQIAKEYKNLRSFALARTEMVRKRVAEREGKHVFAKDSVEDLSKNLSMFFIGPFPTGKATLTKGLGFQLERVISQIKNKKLEIKEIDAFASITGTPQETFETNQTLSEERGKAVAEFLKTKGIEIPAEKVLALGGTTRFGEPLDNQSVVVFATPAAPTTPTPAAPTPPTKP